MSYTSIEQAITIYLKTITGVTDLVSTRLYPSAVPTKQRVYPYVLIESSDEQPIQMTLQRKATVNDKTLRFSIWSTAYPDLVNVAEALRQAMQGYSGTLSGIKIFYIKPSGSTDQTFNPVDGSSDFVFRRMVDYELKYRTPDVNL